MEFDKIKNMYTYFQLLIDPKIVKFHSYHVNIDRYTYRLALVGGPVNSSCDCLGAFPQHTEKATLFSGLYWILILGCVAVKLDIIIIIIIVMIRLIFIPDPKLWLKIRLMVIF